MMENNASNGVVQLEMELRNSTSQQLPLCDKRTIPVAKINNRRYLGNKYRLLPFITNVIAEECGEFDSFADIFAGTDAVASAYTEKKLITNDILYSNYLCHIAWFANEDFDEKKIREYVEYFNSDIPYSENYMTRNFAGTYFADEVCSKIGFVREYIENEYNARKINAKERAILVTSLLYGLDKIANTCGHYDAYRRNAIPNGNLTFPLPIPASKMRQNDCFNCDANELARKIYSDVIYIDPPYNSRQYCDAYHVIENIARWEKPDVFGVAKKMDRSKLKSRYCTKSAPAAFKDLIEALHAKYIVVSYNNMAEKGDDRSNARISDIELTEILKTKGKVKIFSEKFKAFTAGKSDHNDNAERLFVCRCC